VPRIFLLTQRQDPEAAAFTARVYGEPAPPKKMVRAFVPGPAGYQEIFQLVKQNQLVKNK
jgi:hypothetical protein